MTVNDETVNYRVWWESTFIPSRVSDCHLPSHPYRRSLSRLWQHLTPSPVFGGLLVTPLQLVLPETSTRFPTQDGDIFETARRWFDFSNSVMPLPEFERFSTNSTICKPRARFQEESAFYLEGANFRRRCFQLVARLCSLNEVDSPSLDNPFPNSSFIHLVVRSCS